METIFIHTDEAKAKGIKQFLRAFGVSYKTKREIKEKAYNPEFVKMILEASKGPTIPYTEELKNELFGK